MPENSHTCYVYYIIMYKYIYIIVLIIIRTINYHFLLKPICMLNSKVSLNTYYIENVCNRFCFIINGSLLNINFRIHIPLKINRCMEI